MSKAVSDEIVLVNDEQKLIVTFTYVICTFSLAIYVFYIWYGWDIGIWEVSAVCTVYSFGSLVALILNYKGRYSIAKFLVIVNAALSVAFTYQVFTIGFSVLTIFFPIYLAHVYLFDFQQEKRWMILSFIGTTVILASNLFLTRFGFIEVVLEESIADQLDQIHASVSLAITGFLLVVSVQFKNRVNNKLNIQKQQLEATIKELTEARDKLVQSEKMASLGLLTAGINHEINNPLNFLVGGLEHLKDVVSEKDSDEFDTSIRALDEGITRIRSIVKSLNHFNYKSTSSDEDCNPETIIDNCLVMLNHEYKHRIEVHKDFESAAHVKGNSSQLHQVFLNLLANAAQAIDGPGELNIQTKVNGNFVVISIRDSGHGISEEIKYQIFDPFFTTKSPGSGTGLGLFIVYKIIRDHQGAIELFSEEGKGTEFVIHLPIMI